MSTKPQISDAEWLIMNAVWPAKTISAREVIAELASQVEWSPATIKTMLHRLVKKGALRYEQEGNRYRYRAAVRREDCVRRESQSFLDRVFGGDASPMLAHFVKAGKLTDEQIAELKDLLDQAGGDS